jgi:phosphoglucomutase
MSDDFKWADNFAYMVKENLMTRAVTKANEWLADESIDNKSKEWIQHALIHNADEIMEAFHTDLEFGTGGLRGLMGVGSNRMNVYTVSMATQGLANYLLLAFPHQTISVAIAFDCRNNSSLFAQTAAQVLSANGIEVFIYESLRPTPLLSYTVRKLRCMSGIVITASHNPKEYNGYKVYWNDGGQVLPPHDVSIIQEVRKVLSPSAVKGGSNKLLIKNISSQVEQDYLNDLQSLCLSADAIRSHHDLSIVYTPIHGSGITMVTKALEGIGFTNVFIVPDQQNPDGNFSTVASPNPEEKVAMQSALDHAKVRGAKLVLGTDPDADRVGVAVPDGNGDLRLLNGNQAAALLVYYRLSIRRALQLERPGDYIAKTIVTSALLSKIADDFNVPCYETLTGFKYIAEVIRKQEGKGYFVAGGEESYGYSAGEFVRDKDAVLSASQFAEIAAWCESRGSSCWDLLLDIYRKYGLYFEELVSITLKGIDGASEIKAMMKRLRESPPASLGGVKVVELRDVLSGDCLNISSGDLRKLDLPASNVLQFVLADGSVISARPSGTEPKIKFYFSLAVDFDQTDDYDSACRAMELRIAEIKKGLSI